jgi:hypothetical protein
MLIAAIALLLPTAAALAGAPCENPAEPLCRRACAVMGARFALSVRQHDERPSALQVAVGGEDTPEDAAVRLAHMAGLPLDDIAGMTLRDTAAAVAKYCPAD